MSEASFSILALSSEVDDSAAATHMWTARRYPAADSGRLDMASPTHALMFGADFVSSLRTIPENSLLERLGPSEATILTAASMDPPDSRAEVIIPTTVGPPLRSLLLSIESLAI